MAAPPETDSDDGQGSDDGDGVSQRRSLWGVGVRYKQTAALESAAVGTDIWI
jgi:hypothetical protein